MIPHFLEPTAPPSSMLACSMLACSALACLVGCGTEAPPQAPDTQRVKIFLIGVGDGGRRGALLSCGDSAVPVTLMLSADEPPLEGALRALIRLPRSVMTDTGLANTLVHSQLSLASLRVEEGLAEVHLEGTLRSVPSPCQRERVRAQLERTVLQFPEVHEVDLFLNGEPLEAILGRAPGGPNPTSPSRPIAPPEPSGDS